MRNRDWGKIAFLFLLLLLTAYEMKTPGPDAIWNFLKLVYLPIHEAGHFIFIPFGQFLQILGGTIAQILMPFLFCFYFFYTRQYYSAGIAFIWMGASIADVSHYMADAQIMELPLLFGSDIHDWNYLLSTLDLLTYTSFLASLTKLIGMICIAIGFIYSFFHTKKIINLYNK